MSEVGLAVGLSIAAIIIFACVLCVLFRVSLKYCILETVFRDYTSCPSQCMFGCMPDQPIDPKALAETRKHVEGFISGFVRHSFWLDNVQSRNEKIKGDDGYEVPVRIYNHRSCPSKVEAVLVYVHGGGWSVGSVDAYDRFVRALCTLCCADELELPSHIVANASTRIGTFRSIKGRVAIVSVDYRRAPDEAHFPVPLEDCYTAVKWVCAQSLERWGTSNVILCGDSAGGNLICGLARLCRDRGAPQISGQIAVYPVVSYEASLNADDRYEPGFMIKPKSMNALWRDYLHSENNYRNPYANLLAADEHKGLPPTLLIVGTGDVLCREGVEYADALKNNGVRVRKSIYPNMHHSFFGMADIVKEAVQAMAEVKGFVSDIAMSKEDSGSAKSLSHSLHISLEDFSQRSILTGSETQPLLRIDEMT